MTKNDVIQIVQLLTSNTQVSKQFNAAVVVDYWHDKLGSYPIQVVQLACDTILQSAKYFPTFAEMREACIRASREWPPRKVNTTPVDKEKIVHAEMIYMQESANTLASLAERGLDPLGIYTNEEFNQTLEETTCLLTA